MCNQCIVHGNRFRFCPEILQPEARENANNNLLSNLGTVRHLGFTGSGFSQLGGHLKLIIIMHPVRNFRKIRQSTAELLMTEHIFPADYDHFVRAGFQGCVERTVPNLVGTYRLIKGA